ncbi:MAG TPA: DNA-primase RepB domain-containing protein [Bryobacteraceae bacterium]
MFDLALTLTAQAIRRQLTATPCELYLVRLIHNATKRSFPGERLWTATQLASLATIRFLRIRNREGCDVYIHPYAQDRNAGYMLIDLDHAHPTSLSAMRANGHEPCVVLQTSPGHWQAWVQVSSTPLEPALATAVARHLAQLYAGDRASADWRHLGRLAGFTNQKPHRRQRNGYPPWVKIVHAAAGLASHAERVLQAAREQTSIAGGIPHSDNRSISTAWAQTTPVHLPAAQATEIYRAWMRRWHIAQRFPQPDWSIVDLWIARALLARGMSPADIYQILQLGSPGFPRGHSHPDNYLRRTLARAFPVFPAPRRAVCAAHALASTDAPAVSDCSNLTGEQ